MTTRSTFLRTGGALVVTFAAPGVAQSVAVAASGGSSVLYPRVDPAQLDSWIVIAQDGTVTAFTGRIDFGQHKETAFAQIIADELDVPFKAVKVVMGDTARTPNQGSSSASDGILYGARPLRHAAAEARRVLLDLASQKLGAPAAQLVVTGGVVRAPGSSESLSYGQLIGNRRFDITLKVTDPDTLLTDVQGTAQPKSPADYKIVGTSVPGRDIPGKVAGTFPRVHSLRLPQMLHARVILPPSPGAHLIDVGTIHPSVNGIVKGDFIGVVAKNEWAAIRGAANLAVRWSEAQTLPANEGIPKYLRTAAPLFPQKQPTPPVGNVEAGLSGAAKTFEAAYNYPPQNHGMIGPSCGVADVRADRVTAYAGTQDPGMTRASIAKILRVPLETVRLIPMEPSGAYGRLGLDDATVAAAVLSQAVGKPVRVQFTRDQEHTWEPLQPPSTFTLRAGVDASGKIVAWDQEEWSWAWIDAELPLMLIPKSEITGTRVPLFRGVSGGESNAYRFDNLRVRANTAPPLLRGTAMRSPGRVQVNFACEQFIDEIAAATGQDPIEIRFRHLADERTVEVLRAVSAAARWQARPSPGPDAHTTSRIARGRGVSVVANQRSTYIATIAEVEVDRQTGNVAVKRMFVGVDPGLVINPNGLHAQVEGATIYATSRALKEEVKYSRSQVTSSDWLTYPILRFTEVPQIEITVLNQPGKPAGGIGEPPNTTPAAAIGNAIYDAVGIRLRDVPYTPSRVKAALKA